MSTKKKTCFVIMPFSDSLSCRESGWTKIYNEMISPAVTGSHYGYSCERIKPSAGSIIGDILSKLNLADLVIADLTDRNANVFYELGVRHTLSNRTILISQNLDDIPSDLKMYWVVQYKKGVSGIKPFSSEIRRIMSEIIKLPDKSDSPVSDYLNKKNITLMSQEKQTTSKKLAALISEISSIKNSSESILEITKRNVTKRTHKQITTVPTSRLDCTCIRLLLSTRYIEFSETILKDLSAVDTIAQKINYMLGFYIQDETYGKRIEEGVTAVIPALLNKLKSLLKNISKIRRDYINDNYQEPPAPCILLASKEDNNYITST